MYCFWLKDLQQHNAVIGGKARGLGVLQDQGFLVPKFIVIPPEKILELSTTHDYIGVVSEVIEMLGPGHYIIRSNALIEDTQEMSYAGQFMSVSCDSSRDIPAAIAQIVDHARGVLSGRIDLFSLIIQTYVTPDWSGVCFTRSPNGGRQYVLEYHAGSGDVLVSGDITPTHVEAYYTQGTVVNDLPMWNDMAQEFLHLEQSVGYPLDIEWCIRDGVWYVLQARPITTVTPQQYAQLLQLESVLPKETQYRFVKNDITDVVGTPYPFMQSILRLIYQDGGPIAQVYKNHGIQYTNTEQFVSIGKSLYVDAIAEVQSLLPACSIDVSSGVQRALFRRGWLTTIRNMIGLALFRADTQQLSKKLYDGVEKMNAVQSMEQWCKVFCNVYQSVFEVNIYATISLSQLNALIKKIDISNILFLEGSSTIDIQYAQLLASLPALVGNGLAIDDMSAFVAAPLTHMSIHKDVEMYLQSCSIGKRSYIEKKSLAARDGIRLREMGRWVTVLCMTKVRYLIQVQADAKQCDVSNYLYATLSEVQACIDNLSMLQTRKKEFDVLPEFDDTLITSVFVDPSVSSSGISNGIARGVLVRMSELTETSHPQVILYVDTLSPQLVGYFGRVSGICSRRGGVLSHAAIVAREQKIPVIVRSDVDESWIGKMVEIDGADGRIQCV